MKRLAPMLLALGLTASPAMADDLTEEAIIGGALGGAAGAWIGSEIGGREGAILGGALGAAAGTAISTSDHDHDDPRVIRVHDDDWDDDWDDDHRHHFCPPGQAKKGRC